MTTPIPQSAIDAVMNIEVSAGGPVAVYIDSDEMYDILTAALPHLIADLRDRMAGDVVKLTVLAEDPAVLPERRAHLLSKAQGVELSLSKLDELAR